MPLFKQVETSNPMPEFLRWELSWGISKKRAQEIWTWLQSNSNTVITDQLEEAIRKRRDWSPRDEQ